MKFNIYMKINLLELEKAMNLIKEDLLLDLSESASRKSQANMIHSKTNPDFMTFDQNTD